MKSFTFIFLFLSSTLFSQEAPILETNGYPDYFAEEIKKAEEIGDSRFTQEFSNMLLYLAGIVVFIYILMWILKRVMLTRVDQSNRIKSIKVLETRQLNPKTTLYVVEMGNKAFALSDSINGVTYLSEVSVDNRTIPKKPNE